MILLQGGLPGRLEISSLSGPGPASSRRGHCQKGSVQAMATIGGNCSESRHTSWNLFSRRQPAKLKRARVAPLDGRAPPRRLRAPTWPSVALSSSIRSSITWPRPGFAERAEPPQERLAGEGRRRTERQRAGDIDARSARRNPSATVARLPTAAAMAGSASIGGGKASIWRPPWFDTTMPSMPSATAFSASCGCRMPLTTSGPLPAVAIARDLIPGEGAAHEIAREHRRLGEASRRPQHRAAGWRTADGRCFHSDMQPAGRGRDGERHREIGPERRRDAARHFARARGAHRHVEGEHQHMHAGLMGAAREIEADRMAVARETDRAGTTARRARWQRPPRWSCRRRCRACRECGRAGPPRRGSGRRPATRSPGRPSGQCRSAPHSSRPNKVDAGRRQIGDAAIARDQFDGIERAPVARDAAVFAGAAVEIFERKARNAATRLVAQIGDGRIAAPQPDLAGRSDGAGGTRSEGMFHRPVVHRPPDQKWL